MVVIYNNSNCANGLTFYSRYFGKSKIRYQKERQIVSSINTGIINNDYKAWSIN